MNKPDLDALRWKTNCSHCPKCHYTYARLIDLGGTYIVECRQCGLKTNPHPSKEGAEQAWEHLLYEAERRKRGV